ncbi:hypothetical protein HK104_010189, partial [Borealophlyctis nickersoniae]
RRRSIVPSETRRKTLIHTISSEKVPQGSLASSSSSADAAVSSEIQQPADRLPDVEVNDAIEPSNDYSDVVMGEADTVTEFESAEPTGQEEDQPDGLGQDHTNLTDDRDVDLMDEHLSMIEHSFAAEAELESNGLITLEQFLRAAEVKFEDGFDKISRPHKASYDGTVAVSEIDYVRAAALTIPELKARRATCEGMVEAIAHLREKIVDLDREIAEEPPFLFGEFSLADQTEKKEIMQKLNATKKVSQWEAKEAISTRMLAMFGQSIESRSAYLEALKADLETIKDLSGRLHPLMKQLIACRNQKRARLDEFQRSLANQKNEEEAKLEGLARDKQELRGKAQALTAEIEQLKTQCEGEQVREQALIRQRDSLTQAIEKAENICKDLVVFDPQDLASLRDETRLLESMFPWRMMSVNANRIMLLYDDVVQIAFSKTEADKFKLQLSLAQDNQAFALNMFARETPQSSRAAVQSIGRTKIGLLLDQVAEDIGLCDSAADIKKVMNRVAHFWNSIRRFHLDVERTREECTISYDDDAGESGLLRATGEFFSRKRRAKLSVTVVGLGNKGRDVYTLSEMKWDAQIHYGNIRAEDVHQIMVATEPGEGRVLRAFRKLKLLVDGTSGGDLV